MPQADLRALCCVSPGGSCPWDSGLGRRALLKGARGLSVLLCRPGWPHPSVVHRACRCPLRARPPMCGSVTETQRWAGPRGTGSPCTCAHGSPFPDCAEATPSPVPEAWPRAQGGTSVFRGALHLPGGCAHVRTHSTGTPGLDRGRGLAAASGGSSFRVSPSPPDVVQQEETACSGAGPRTSASVLVSHHQITWTTEEEADPKHVCELLLGFWQLALVSHPCEATVG